MTEFVFLVRNAPINIEAILKSREDRIRTCDPLVPNQVRYRPALLPVFRKAKLDLYEQNNPFKAVREGFEPSVRV